MPRLFTFRLELMFFANDQKEAVSLGDLILSKALEVSPTAAVYDIGVQPKQLALFDAPEESFHVQPE